MGAMTGAGPEVAGWEFGVIRPSPPSESEEVLACWLDSLKSTDLKAGAQFW